MAVEYDMGENQDWYVAYGEEPWLLSMIWVRTMADMYPMVQNHGCCTWYGDMGENHGWYAPYDAEPWLLSMIWERTMAAEYDVGDNHGWYVPYGAKP